MANHAHSGRNLDIGEIDVAGKHGEKRLWYHDHAIVKTYPGYITRVIQKFDLPPGTPTTPGKEFRYVWHCHILEHEGNEMMRPAFAFQTPTSPSGIIVSIQ